MPTTRLARPTSLSCPHPATPAVPPRLVSAPWALGSEVSWDSRQAGTQPGGAHPLNLAHLPAGQEA